MRTAMKLLIVPLLLAVLLALAPGQADAARFGGGRSFGGGGSFSRSYSKPITPQRQSTFGSSSATQGMRQPSRFGGMGGLFGGLLAGSLLGSLFFGHPFAGGGLMDILLIGGLIFLFLKMFGGRRPSPQATAGRDGGMSYGGGGPQTGFEGAAERRAQNAWGGLGATPGQADAAPGVQVPAGFDTEEFLKGAKLAFNRLQASWDARDLSDIAQFTSEEVLSEIRSQAAADPRPSRTDVLMVNARLLEVQEEGANLVATVYFDALMREEQGGATEQVREVWHFKKNAAERGGMWLLYGLQQLEN